LTAQQFAVKIVDAAKFTAIPSLTLDSKLSLVLVYFQFLGTHFKN
jgi:hypothetical protein